MPKRILTNFEIIANPVAPGVKDVPYVQQGFFLQVSNLEGSPTRVTIEYIGTPPIESGAGAVKLFANFINQTGVIDQYPTATFLTAPVGFKSLVVPAHATWLFGVQYLLLPPPAPTLTPATGATPQDSLEARGVVSIEAHAGSKLLVLATVRQVFNNYDAANKLIDVTEGAYSVPLVGGPEHVF